TSDPETAQLRWFLVHPRARGHGFGRDLLGRALAFCREQRYGRVILWTVRGLDAAARLYAAAGFVRTEESESKRWGAAVVEQRYEIDLTASHSRLGGCRNLPEPNEFGGPGERFG
ncbi:MAG TPA: GNAT family N-acetyltransferase, partial [Fimbriimonadaceae bacterium]|nr:GNAT family N-acetyltransferase [Fimbriimonadaceae bacterium]